MKVDYMITIKEIAEMAGVSSATVSKVLNGKDKYISEFTRRRILEIVEREEYIPNGIAKSLRMKNTRTIGLIMPDVMNLFFSELAKGVEDAAEKKGYSVILCNTDNNQEKEERYINILQEKMVDGIIMAAAENSVTKSLERYKAPLVLVDRDIELNKKVGRITVDNEEGGYMATSFLIEKGCKNIGFISSKKQAKPSAERFKGYRKALETNSIKFQENITYFDSFKIETGYLGALSILEKGKVDGIFCGNDLIAIGALKALKEKKVRIPEDIKIIGFDNIATCDFLDPPLTTIKQPIYEIGENAVQILIDIIEDNDRNLNKVLSPSLIERGSV